MYYTITQLTSLDRAFDEKNFQQNTSKIGIGIDFTEAQMHNFKKCSSQKCIEIRITSIEDRI